MRTANQLTFTIYEASLKIKSKDPIKVIFDNIDWSFIHALVRDKYCDQGTDGYDPISLFEAQLLFYLGEVSSDRKHAAALGYTRLCFLCGFNFLKTPSNGTFYNFRNRIGNDTFYEILHNLIAQAIALKAIQGEDTATDSTHIWAYSNKFGKKTCSCKGKCHCPRECSDSDAKWGHKTQEYAFFGYKVPLIMDTMSQLPLDVIVTPGNKSDSPYANPLLKEIVLSSAARPTLGKCQGLSQPFCSSSSYGKTFYLHPDRDYRLVGTIPRGTNLWQEKYNVRTSVERAYSEEKGSHHLADPRVRGLFSIKIHVYLALCDQVLKRIGAAIIQGVVKPQRAPCPAIA